MGTTSHKTTVGRFSPCSAVSYRQISAAHAYRVRSNHARIMTQASLAEVRTKMVLVHLNGINTPAGALACLGFPLPGVV